MIDFLHTGSLAVPRHYHAQYVVVAQRRFDLPLELPKVYEDSRFVLYRVTRPPSSRR